jgi:hypothetical protein
MIAMSLVTLIVVGKLKLLGNNLAFGLLDQVGMSGKVSWSPITTGLDVAVLLLVNIFTRFAKWAILKKIRYYSWFSSVDHKFKLNCTFIWDQF